MKKDLVTKFSFLITFFILISLYKGWLALIYLPFWFGGVIGMFLPDIDYLLYAYLLRPHELVSQRIQSQVTQRNAFKVWQLIHAGKDDPAKLIVHTSWFYLVFFVFAFLVLSSSGSIFGRGLVLAFLLHLLIDQATDLIERGSLASWFRNLPVRLDKEQERWYLVGGVILLLVFGFLM
jgi:hypothetical protein